MEMANPQRFSAANRVARAVNDRDGVPTADCSHLEALQHAAGSVPVPRAYPGRGRHLWRLHGPAAHGAVAVLLGTAQSLDAAAFCVSTMLFARLVMLSDNQQVAGPPQRARRPLQRVGRRAGHLASSEAREPLTGLLWPSGGRRSGWELSGREDVLLAAGAHGRPGRGSTLPASPAGSNDMSVRYDRQSERDVPTVKMTLRLEPEVATILRGVAADFGLAQHEAVSLLAKWFVRTAGHKQQRIVFDGPVAERIEEAVADWRRRLERAGISAGKPPCEGR